MAAVKSIVHSQLVERGRIKKHRRELGRLEWDDDVLERLVDEVEFEGKYAIEGGKEVSIVLSRCVTRALEFSPNPRSRARAPTPSAFRTASFAIESFV